MASAASFLQFPRILFMHESYKKLSTEAKVIYMLMLDRYKLSTMNNWKDAVGIFIKMTRKSMCEFLNRSEPTIRKFINELKEAGLITEKRVGLTQANKIYVRLLEGESEPTVRIKPKNEAKPAQKPAYVPETRDYSPNDRRIPNQIQLRRLPSKPEFPRIGDVWEENGCQFAYLRKGIQRYYAEEELNSLFYDPYADKAVVEEQTDSEK